jgi:nitrite reductase (NADH) large subunit
MEASEDLELVCFCNHVTKADICRAIDEKGLKTTGEVMAETYAAGLCGSCLDRVNAVTKEYVSKE